MTFLILSQQSLSLLPLTIFKTASIRLCMTLFLYVIVDSWYAWFANSFLLCYNNDILFVCNKKCFCLLDNTKINNDNMSVILIVNVEITSMAFQIIRYNYAMYTEYALIFSFVDALRVVLLFQLLLWNNIQLYPNYRITPNFHLLIKSYGVCAL